MFILMKNAQNNIQKLWQFVQILVANSLDELQTPNSLNNSLQLRAKKFICDRLRLLLASGYSQITKLNDLEENNSDELIISTSIWRLKFSEKTILDTYLNIFSEKF